MNVFRTMRVQKHCLSWRRRRMLRKLGASVYKAYDNREVNIVILPTTMGLVRNGVGLYELRNQFGEDLGHIDSLQSYNGGFLYFWN